MMLSRTCFEARRNQLMSFGRCLSAKTNAGRRKTKKEGTKQARKSKDIVIHRKKQQVRQNRLHPAAKWKRILSSVHHWFSEKNILNDGFMKETLRRHNGWLPISVLLSFPRFRNWTNAQLLVDALTTSIATKKFEVTFDETLYIARRKECVLASTASSSDESNEVATPCDIEEWRNEQSDSDTGTEASAMSSSNDVAIRGTEPPHCFVDDDVRTLNETLASVDLDAHDSVLNERLLLEDEFFDDDFDSTLDEEEGDIVDTRQTSIQHVESSSSRIPERAAVRHRRVTLQYLDGLDQKTNAVEHASSSRNSSFHRHGKFALEERRTAKGLIRFSDLAPYECQRRIVLIQDQIQLETFCYTVIKSARQSAKDHENQPKACAVGFDVEYCTLDFDIRGTLPAMIQISAPTKDGCTGLIWLDKFPNHGRNMLLQTPRGSFQKLLVDSTILKVGVGATNDMVNLARWWGIQTKDNHHHFFSGFVNIEDDIDTVAAGNSLVDLSAYVLQRKNRKSKKEQQRNTRQRMKLVHKTAKSHWRRQTLTNRMREYAACDAACSVDIWMKYHQF